MADLNARIKPKKSSAAGEVPQAADLEVAEIAVNTADGKLFVKHTDNSIKEISGAGGGATAIDDLSDVDTSTAAPTDGQVLTWVDANSQWEPADATGGGGAVDSVNGQTGIVSLGVQDMNDFELAVLAGVYELSNKVADTTDNPDVRCWNVNGPGTTIYLSPDETFLRGSLSSGDEITLSVPGLAQPHTATLSTDVVAGTGNWYEFSLTPSITASEILSAADGTPLTVSSIAIGGSAQPLAEGDILRWVDADQKFKPTQIPANGVVSWSVTADGTSNYIFAGDGFAGTETDPVLYVVRGQTYEITNSMGAHPFQIQSTSGLGGTAYSDGITNNAVSNGILTWEVRLDAPAELYYQCTAHADMGGTIQVLENGGGAVDSVNGQTGVVSLGTEDLTNVSGTAPVTLTFTQFNTSPTLDSDFRWNTTADFFYYIKGGVNETYFSQLQLGDVVDWDYDGNQVSRTVTRVQTDSALTGYWDIQFDTAGMDTAWRLLAPQTATSSKWGPADGQVLTWVEANSQWEPTTPSAGSGAVDSVNGQTGVVSLGAGDLSDVQYPAGTTPSWDGVSSSTWATASGSVAGTLVSVTNSTYFSPVSQEGDQKANLRAWLATLSFNVDLTFVVDGVETVMTVTGVTDQMDEAPSAYQPRLIFNIFGNQPDMWLGSTVYIKEFTDYLGSVGSPSDGQVLTWVDANSQWEPATPSGGGGAVDSVNGQTGVVDLALEDMNDVQVLGTSSYFYNFSTSDVNTPLSGEVTVWSGGGYGDQYLFISTTDKDGRDSETDVYALSAGDTLIITVNGTQVFSGPAGANTGINDNNNRASLDFGSVQGWITNLTNSDVVGIGSPTFSAPPTGAADGQVLTWVDANSQWEPASVALGDLADVDTTTIAPFNEALLAWNDADGKWEPSGFGGVPSSTVNGDTTTYPLHGIDGFYADQAALEADGFTFIAGSIDADDAALSFAVPAAYQGIDYLGCGYASPSGTNWFINSNGGVGYSLTGQTTVDRSGNSATASANIDFYVSWFNHDTSTRLAGYKEITDGGRDWLVVRADMKVPYNSATNGIVVEAWFATDGSISVRYGTVIATNIPFTSGAHTIYSRGSTLIGNVYDGLVAAPEQYTYIYYAASAGVVINMDDLSNVSAGSPSDGQVLTWVDANSRWEPGDYISKATLKAEVAAATDFANFQARIAAL